MEHLFHLRHIIASLDEALVDSLCTRARRRLNAALYALPVEPVPDLQILAGHFAESPSLASRAHVLRPLYLCRLLPALCAPGEDKGQPACLSADGACLDALARRLALSVHVATRKLEAIPAALQAAILARDPVRVEQAITNPSVEVDVLVRVKGYAEVRASGTDTATRIARLYAEWIIPLSRKIQVHGLLVEP